MSKYHRPVVLVIGGFDPSGGAGVLADIKTLEQHKVYGVSLITGNTLQSEKTFERVDWIDPELLIQSLEWLMGKYKISIAKIGLIQNIDIAGKIAAVLYEKKIPVIWDTVIKTSSGKNILDKSDQKELISVLKRVFLITPNWEEIRFLSGLAEPEAGAKQLSEFCHVFLKGGHRSDKPGVDLLFTKEGRRFSFNPKKTTLSEKHGSGCVLSSSLAANLALGFGLQRACLKAKDYTASFLRSNKTLLGYHKL